MPSVQVETIVICAVFGALMWWAEHIDLDYWRDCAARIIYSCSQPLSQRILLCVHLSIYAVCAARTGEADILADMLRPLVASPDAAPIQRVLGYNVLGIVAYQRGAREEWMAAIMAARTLSSERAVHHVDNAVFHTAVYGALMTNDFPAAQGFLREMDRTTAGDSRLSDVAVYHHCAAMVALYQVDLGTAQEHSRRSLEIAIANCANLSQIFAHVCMAQILFAGGVRIYVPGRSDCDAHFPFELGHTAQGLEHLRRALVMSRRAEGCFPVLDPPHARQTV